MKKFVTSLPFILLVSVVLGIVLGLFVSEEVMNVIITVKHVLGQVIFFTVPLIIIGFIAPAITSLGNHVSRVLGLAVLLAYVSSVGAALFSMVSGYSLIPHLSIITNPEGLRELPEIIFKLDIPQIMPVMSALVLSVLVGLSAVWTKAEIIARILGEFRRMVLAIVKRVVIPILPVFIALTFCALSYEGTITQQLPIFITVVAIVIVGHYLWLALLYGLSGAYAKKNPLLVLKHYAPAYLTAVGTMSSAATLPVALECASKAVPPLRKDMVSFGIPLFANIHLCGSVLTEVFFVMTISQILYGSMPDLSTMVLFCFLLGIFAIGAPGVPGGTVVASLGLISGVLGFDATGTALVLTVFALQDSFGTACNVTGDGALTLALSGYVEKHNIQDTGIDVVDFEEDGSLEACAHEVLHGEKA